MLELERCVVTSAATTATSSTASDSGVGSEESGGLGYSGGKGDPGDTAGESILWRLGPIDSRTNRFPYFGVKKRPKDDLYLPYKRLKFKVKVFRHISDHTPPFKFPLAELHNIDNIKEMIKQRGIKMKWEVVRKIKGKVM